MFESNPHLEIKCYDAGLLYCRYSLIRRHDHDGLSFNCDLKLLNSCYRLPEIFSPTSSMASPTFRRALPKPSRTLPPARSASPSASRSRSFVTSPTLSLTAPFT